MKRCWLWLATVHMAAAACRHHGSIRQSKEKTQDAIRKFMLKLDWDAENNCGVLDGNTVNRKNVISQVSLFLFH